MTGGHRQLLEEIDFEGWRVVLLLQGSLHTGQPGVFLDLGDRQMSVSWWNRDRALFFPIAPRTAGPAAQKKGQLIHRHRQFIGMQGTNNKGIGSLLHMPIKGFDQFEYARLAAGSLK